MNPDHRAISLWEPWATAMALGLKANETRHWPTNYRGDLVICSAKRKMTPTELLTWDTLVKPAFPYELRLGYALCIVELYDCIPTERFYNNSRGIDQREFHLGNYSPGRFAWLTRNLRKLRNPVPVVGRQGLWVLPPTAMELIRLQ